MTIELKMPALSPTMEKGALVKWLVAEGDAIKPGDLLAEIETEKATMEYEAIDEGVIASLLVAEGTGDVAVGTVIARLAAPGEGSPAVVAAQSLSVEAPAPTIDAAPAAAQEEDVAPPQRARLSPAERIKISPLAQRIAEAKGIDLAQITGSGANGRIVRADLGLTVPAALPVPQGSAPPAASTPATFAPPPSGVPVETVKLSTMRKTIARRLTESKQTVPHFCLTARCNLDPLLALRAELNEAIAPRGIKLSVNDFLIKALALALAAVPDANVQFGGDVLHRFTRVDIAMAVAIDGGLVTPVIRDVGNLSLAAIAQASQTLAQKARSGKLTLEDYEGGTASISNLGMYGIDEMIPVINPPQALILGCAAGVELPWKVDGEVQLATIMAATASFDHRAIDGAVAAQFMRALRQLIESPLLLCS